MASAALQNQRQLSRRTENLMARQGAVLASAPVKPEPAYPPITFTEAERAAATVRVAVEPLMLDETGDSFETAGRLAYYSEHGNRGNDLAALRAQLTGVYLAGSETRPGLQADPGRTGDREHVGDGPRDFGPDMRLAVLLSMDGGLTAKKLIVEGSWAAVLRSLPDATTVKAWREAGALEFPVMLEPGRTTWVAIAEVPVVLQMEYEARGMVSNGSGS